MIEIDGVNNKILDTNLNEVLRLPATASAVNDVTITNAATGIGPAIAATGDDTNIDLLIQGKGTGLVHVDNGTITGSASAGAATLNKAQGTITSEALTTAAGSDYTLTLTNSKIKTTSQVFASLDNGSNTTAPIYVRLVTVANGSVVIIVRNGHASSALNGTIKISFVVF